MAELTAGPAGGRTRFQAIPQSFWALLLRHCPYCAKEASARTGTVLISGSCMNQGQRKAAVLHKRQQRVADMSVWPSALVLWHAITLGLQLQAHFCSVQRQCGYLRAAMNSKLEQVSSCICGERA